MQECPYEGYDGFVQYMVDTDMDQVEARANSGSIMAVRAPARLGEAHWQPEINPTRIMPR